MFWKKKPVATVPAGVVSTGAAPAGITPPVTKVEAPAKPKAEKLPGPREIPELVGRYLVVAKKREPDWVWRLKAVVRKNPGRGKKVLDVRVFDEAQAAQQHVKVKDWTTFDEHPDLILYEGWFDKDTMQAELAEKKTA